MNHAKNALTHLSDALFILLVRSIVMVSVPVLAIRDTSFYARR